MARIEQPPPKPVGQPSRNLRAVQGCGLFALVWVVSCSVTLRTMGVQGILGGFTAASILGVAMHYLRGPQATGRRRLKHLARAADRAGLETQRLYFDTLQLDLPDGTIVTLAVDGQAQATARLEAPVPEGWARAAISLDAATEPSPPSGDPAFDETVGVRGDPAIWRGLWDAETRRALARAVEADGVRIEDGILIGETRFLARAGGVHDLTWLDNLAQLAHTLVHDPTRAPARLLSRVFVEGGAVGLAAFESLQARWPEAEETARAARKLRSEAEAGSPIGVAVGIMLGDLALCEAALPAATRPSQRWGVERLAEAWPHPARLDKLSALLSGPPAVQAAALRALTRLNHPLPADRLAATACDDPEVASAMAAYLGKVTTPAPEPVWVNLLASRSGAVRLASIDALATLGTQLAVGPLGERARDAAVAERRAARAALSAVRERLAAHASAGQLAVVAEGTGQLAIAPDAHGGLSPADDGG